MDSITVGKIISTIKKFDKSLFKIISRSPLSQRNHTLKRLETPSQEKDKRDRENKRYHNAPSLVKERKAKKRKRDRELGKAREKENNITTLNL